MACQPLMEVEKKNESTENKSVDLNEEDTLMFRMAIANSLNKCMVTENNVLGVCLRIIRGMTGPNDLYTDIVNNNA